MRAGAVAMLVAAAVAGGGGAWWLLVGSGDAAPHDLERNEGTLAPGGEFPVEGVVLDERHAPAPGVHVTARRVRDLPPSESGLPDEDPGTSQLNWLFGSEATPVEDPKAEATSDARGRFELRLPRRGLY